MWITNLLGGLECGDVYSASGLVKMGRDAVGARLEPKGGLQTYFEPKNPSQR